MSLSVKAIEKEDRDFREIMVNGKPVRLKIIKLNHPFKEGDAVKLVRQARGYKQ